ncbi:MAG: PAS domain S-box protein [Planctomycetota bacterium]|nr:PAS domain S-box protein [Planctomycetota bacterium]
MSPHELSTDSNIARFFDLSLDLLCIAGTDGYLKRVSPSFVSLLGHTEQELTSRPWIEFVHPDDIQATLRFGRRLSAGRDAKHVVTRLRHADGSYRTLEWNASIPEGETLIYAVARDITEAERQAELMEQTHRTAGVGGWDLDLQSGELRWTSETYRLHETSPDAYTPTVATAIDFYAPESVPIITSAVERATAFGEPYDLELELVTAKGRRIWVRAVGEVEMAPSGPVRLFGAFQDISERKARELMQRRFETMSKGTPDFIGIANPDMTVQYVNRSGLAMAGRESYEDTRVSDFHPAWALEKFRAEALPAAMRDGFWKGEIALQHADGHEIPVYMICMAFKDAQGELEFASCIMRDLSEQKALERQLLQSQKLEAVGQLAGGIAHDFNNLLTAIVGNAECAAHEITAHHPTHVRLEQIMRAAQRGASLTSQLLGFARAQLAQPRVIDLEATLADTRKLLTHVIDESIELVVEPGADLWLVRMDPAQLEQVVLNLALNARDAMPRGGTLRISTRNVVASGGLPGLELTPVHGEFVELRVEDSGAGMDMAVMDQAFEPFFTTKEVGKGSGLGLAMCHGIVRQNDGHIALDSRPGEGTTVRIWLPRCTGAAPRVEATVAEPASAGSGTILVVEDEAAVLRMVVMALEGHGYEVLGAATPDEALTIARSHEGKIDLLLTDVVLPDMDGRQLAEAVAVERPGIKMVYVSGYSQDHISDRGVLAEDVHFIQKPYRPSELAASIARVLAD